MPKKPVVVVTRKLPDAIETRMMELFDARLNLSDEPMSHADLVEAVKDADILVPTVTDRLGPEVINEAGERLKLITDLLMRMHKSPIDQNVAAEIFKRIQSRMDQVPGEILDDFVVQDEELKFWSEGAEATVGRVDKNLLKILDDSKTRANRRKKEHIQLNLDKNFTDQDFEAIAADFAIPIRDAQEVIRLYQNLTAGVTL